MKKLFSLAAIVIFSLSTNAQETPAPSSSMPGALGKIAAADDLFIVSITSDNWMNLPSTIEAKPLRSRGFSFLIMKEKMGKAGHFGLGYGFGISSQNVHTDAVFYYDDVAKRNYFAVVPDSFDLETNKLSLNFIDFALELRARTNENDKGKRFKVAAGLKGGYLIQSHTKYEDRSGKFKSCGMIGLNYFQYGVTGRIGYGSVALSGYYSLVDVFKKDKGPELTPLNVGISFTF